MSACEIEMSDFENIPELKGLETALRCGICFDYLSTAMMIGSCSHNYCSLCIRRVISYKQQCPSCRTPAVETDLRNNRTLDDMVELFFRARPKLIRAVRGLPLFKESHTVSNFSTQRMKSAHSTSSDLLDSPKHVSAPLRTYGVFSKKSNSKPVAEGAPQFLRKMESKENETVSNSDATLSSMSSQKTVVFQISESNFSEDNANVDYVKVSFRNEAKNRPNEDENDEDFSPVKSPKITGSLKSPGCFSSPPVSGPLSTTQSAKKNDKAWTTCPSCQTEVLLANINTHLDLCLFAGEKKDSLRSHPPMRKPLAKVVYNLLSDKELKKKLTEVGLPLNGDRKMMIERHREFTLRYNSQCDAALPKSTKEIVKEVLDAENQMQQYAKERPIAKILKLDKASSESDIESAQKEYVKQHKSQFSELIEQAKKSRLEKRAASSTVTTASLSISTESSSSSFATHGERNDSMQVQLGRFSEINSGISMNGILSEASVQNDATVRSAKNEDASTDEEYQFLSAHQPGVVEDCQLPISTRNDENENNCAPGDNNDDDESDLFGDLSPIFESQLRSTAVHHHSKATSINTNSLSGKDGSNCEKPMTSRSSSKPTNCDLNGNPMHIEAVVILTALTADTELNVENKRGKESSSLALVLSDDDNTEELKDNAKNGSSNKSGKKGKLEKKCSAKKQLISATPFDTSEGEELADISLTAARRSGRGVKKIVYIDDSDVETSSNASADIQQLTSPSRSGPRYRTLAAENVKDSRNKRKAATTDVEGKEDDEGCSTTGNGKSKMKSTVVPTIRRLHKKTSGVNQEPTVLDVEDDEEDDCTADKKEKGRRAGSTGGSISASKSNCRKTTTPVSQLEAKPASNHEAMPATRSHKKKLKDDSTDINKTRGKKRKLEVNDDYKEENDSVDDQARSKPNCRSQNAEECLSRGLKKVPPRGRF